MVGTFSTVSVDDIYSFTRKFRIPFLTTSMGKEFLAANESPTLYEKDDPPSVVSSEAPEAAEAKEARTQRNILDSVEVDIGKGIQGTSSQPHNERENKDYSDSEPEQVDSISNKMNSYVLSVRPRFTKGVAELMLFYEW